MAFGLLVGLWCCRLMDVLKPPLVYIGNRCYRKNVVVNAHPGGVTEFDEEDFSFAPSVLMILTLCSDTFTIVRIIITTCHDCHVLMFLVIYLFIMCGVMCI